jgi:hypothetical protein
MADFPEAVVDQLHAGRFRGAGERVAGVRDLADRAVGLRVRLQPGNQVFRHRDDAVLADLAGDVVEDMDFAALEVDFAPVEDRQPIGAHFLVADHREPGDHHKRHEGLLGLAGGLDRHAGGQEFLELLGRVGLNDDLLVLDAHDVVEYRPGLRQVAHFDGVPVHFADRVPVVVPRAAGDERGALGLVALQPLHLPEPVVPLFAGVGNDRAREIFFDAAEPALEIIEGVLRGAVGRAGGDHLIHDHRHVPRDAALGPVVEVEPDRLEERHAGELVEGLGIFTADELERPAGPLQELQGPVEHRVFIFRDLLPPRLRVEELDFLFVGFLFRIGPRRPDQAPADHRRAAVGARLAIRIRLVPGEGVGPAAVNLNEAELAAGDFLFRFRRRRRLG